jgi:hypothetical protein
MNIIHDLLASFIGGELEIINVRNEHRTVGCIESLIVEDGKICVIFRWAWERSSNTAPWIKSPMESYYQATSIFQNGASSIGLGKTGGERVSMASPFADDMLVFYPPDGHIVSVRGENL